MANPDIHIIGAGPVGLAAALLLAAQDRRVTIHEARDAISLTDANSYPIGVNPRGQETLRRIDSRLVEELRAQGELVEGFKIRAGRRMLASMRSGTIIGTTRARLTGILLAAAQQDRRITLSTGHRLEAIDLASRTLQFTGTTTVEVGNGLVIACDGVWSKTRQTMAEQLADFVPEVSDWGVQFRVLFSAPGAMAPGLDPNWHHIFTGKGIYTATLPDGVWCVAVTAIKGDPAEALLLSTEPTEDHINALHRHLRQYAPLVLPLLTRDAYVDFFGRAPFSGAVVRCPRVSHDEWLVLLGDAAHSVIPPTGEGVNSGLEDAMLLADALASGSPTPLREYDEGRIPDLKALGEYACHLKDNIANEDPVRSASNVGLRVLSAVAGLVGQKSGELESRLFGPDAGRMPYRDAIGPWIQFRDRWTPPLRRIATGVVRCADKPISAEPQTLVAPQREGARRRISVIGGSSGTGKELAELALKRGFDVTCLSRRGAGPIGARLISGDAHDPEIVRQALKDATAAFVTVSGGSDDSRDRTAITQAVLKAAGQTGLRRIIVQSSLGAGSSARMLPPGIRHLATRMLAPALADHTTQEQVVQESGLDWTIVRPVGLTNKRATGMVRELRDDESGWLGWPIPRADVAGHMLRCLDDKSTIQECIAISGRCVLGQHLPSHR